MLSGGEYARIKTESKPHVGREGEPVAELTKLGWFNMSPGEEFDRSTMLSNKEFYIPHKAVVKESAEKTKTRIVYDASARASSDAQSLKECSNPGPSLQNKLWDVLV